MMISTNQPIHLIDFEGNTRTGVIEYGVATLSGDHILSVKTRYCRGRAPIEAQDSRWHGIENRSVQNAEPLEADWDYFATLRKEGPLGAHHASIEDTLLRQAWPSAGMVPDFLKGEGSTPEWGPWIDTRRLYAYLFPDLESHQLMDLIRLFRLDAPLRAWVVEHCPEGRRRHHCALHDALASAVLLRNISKFPGFEEVDLPWLLRHSAGSRQEKEGFLQRDLF